MSEILSELYDVAKRYVESIGGTALVGGGTEIMQYSTDLEYNYRLVIKLTGVPPKANTPVPKEDV